MATFTKVVLIICLVTDMVDWKQKLKNQWVQIEINRIQLGQPGNFFLMVSFSFQYSSGKGRPEQSRAGQIRAGPGRSGQVGAGPGRSRQGQAVPSCRLQFLNL